VSSLRTQVQRVGGGQAHPKVQRHQEQQTIILFKKNVLPFLAPFQKLNVRHKGL
jgi:hypothetical protein